MREKDRNLRRRRKRRAERLRKRRREEMALKKPTRSGKKTAKKATPKPAADQAEPTPAKKTAAKKPARAVAAAEKITDSVAGPTPKAARTPKSIAEAAAAARKLMAAKRKPVNQRQLAAGVDTYADTSLISGDAAAHILRTLWAGHFDFPDFNARTPADALEWDRFKATAGELVAERGGVDPALKRMFDIVAGESDALFITIQQLTDRVSEAGVDRADKRLGQLGVRLQESEPDEHLTPSEFVSLCAPNIAFLRHLILS